MQLAVAVCACTLPLAALSEVKLGFLGGFTGPVESVTPHIFASAKLATEQVNQQGGLLDGETLQLMQGDTACAETEQAQAAAEQLLEDESVVAFVGALCSSATLEAAKRVAIPRNVVMLTPASTSPAVTALEDNDLVFRSAPSDAYQGQVMARLLQKKGIVRIAIAYAMDDYGVGFYAALSAAFTDLGGEVVSAVSIADTLPDYSSNIATLAEGGSNTLVVLADASRSGTTMLKQAVESGEFANFAVGDRMIDQGLIAAIGANALQYLLATNMVTPQRSEALQFREFMRDAGQDPDRAFSAQSYDAAFLLALAIEKNGSRNRSGVNAALREVATAPGELIMPGEWRKAKTLIADGKDINYQGAGSDHEFDSAGDVAGMAVQMAVKRGEFVVARPLF
ncbi:MAG: ABC transporter substrate-binding protein [Pseudomonadota bacterium]